MQFKKAERVARPIKLALTGPSGSGKTLSSLKMAAGIGGKIAVIDTENGSASLYSDRYEFDALTLSPPYTIQKYLDAMNLASKSGYDVVIVDSISHAWAGDGGLLSQKESADARGGNQYTNWAPITKQQEVFKSFILNYPKNLICTMRSKQDYVMADNGKGKQAPIKVGLAPVQRDGMEYEFDTVFDIAMNHEAQTSKDRTGLFDGFTFVISEETASRIVEWKRGDKPIEHNVEKELINDPHSEINFNVFCELAKSCQSFSELEQLYKANRECILVNERKDDLIQLFNDMKAAFKSVENERSEMFNEFKVRIKRVAFEDSLKDVKEKMSLSNLTDEQIKELDSLIEKRRLEIIDHGEVIPVITK